MQKFLKLLIGDFTVASRDKREISVVDSLGAQVVVMAKGSENRTGNEEGYTVCRRTTRPIGQRRWQVVPNRVISVFTWAWYARQIKPRCVSCHDLIALLIGWISTWFVPKSRRPLLVYDSHEFEIGRNIAGRSSRLTRLAILITERFLMKKCTFTIVVNDSIADEMQRIHRLKERPVVVRNIPSYWPIDEDVCRRRKWELCKQLGVAEDTFIVMYHGAIMPGRGIEMLLQSIARLTGVAAVILGYGKEGYLDHLKRMAAQLQISDRVLFHDAVPIDVLWQYVGAADAGVSLAPNTCMNHYYMLPNKLFECIQSLTPIIGSDFPEIRRVVRNYDIGLLVDPESGDEIDKALEKMRMDREMYQRFKRNLRRAKEDLCWEKEKKVLEEAYSRILA